MTQQGLPPIGAIIELCDDCNCSWYFKPARGKLARVEKCDDWDPDKYVLARLLEPVLDDYGDSTVSTQYVDGKHWRFAHVANTHNSRI